MACCSPQAIKDSKVIESPGDIHDSVKEYYGKAIATKQDLQVPDAVCNLNSVPEYIRNALGKVHQEITKKYYGCGLVAPEKLEGTRILDLGSGSGQDCYVLSNLVGASGHVTGIDMTEEQLSTAREYIDYHTKLYGYEQPNVNFVHGYIEKLGEAGLKDNTFDIIISNCVINLSPDKKAVIKEAYRVLKEGGELYFSDIYADRNLPDEVKKHQVLWGECIAGCLFWEDLHKLAKEIGFSTPLLVKSREIIVERQELKDVLGDARFVSVTYRLFKVKSDTNASVSQAVYQGGILGSEETFTMDYQKSFKKGEAVIISQEVAAILSSSRFSNSFSITPRKDGVAKEESPANPITIAERNNAKSSCCAPSTCCS